jgi:hypothetical protein
MRECGPMPCGPMLSRSDRSDVGWVAPRLRDRRNDLRNRLVDADSPATREGGQRCANAHRCPGLVSRFFLPPLRLQRDRLKPEPFAHQGDRL